MKLLNVKNWDFRVKQDCSRKGKPFAFIARLGHAWNWQSRRSRAGETSAALCCLLITLHARVDAYTIACLTLIVAIATYVAISSFTTESLWRLMSFWKYNTCAPNRLLSFCFVAFCQIVTFVMLHPDLLPFINWSNCHFCHVVTCFVAFHQLVKLSLLSRFFLFSRLLSKGLICNDMSEGHILNTFLSHVQATDSSRVKTTGNKGIGSYNHLIGRHNPGKTL